MLDNSILYLYNVATMYIHRAKKKVKDKVYTSTLLMHNHREGKKIRHKTIMNISKWKESEIEALDRVLKGARGMTCEDIEIKQSKSIGAIWVFKKLSDELGITEVLGETRSAKVAMLLILSRIITQGSRRHAMHWKDTQEIGYVLGLEDLKKDELYNALDELDNRQKDIEKELFKKRYGVTPPSLYLYDVTSSYLEGSKNELGNWGYNRDGKKGTQQIVIGLLMGEDGHPISVEVFEGNTCDTKTVVNQIEALKYRFCVKKVTLVGDKGMIKGPQIETLSDEGITYITSITKAQIQTLIKNETFQLSLFEDRLIEVTDEDIRYIMRRNPVRQIEMAETRNQKLSRVKEYVDQENKNLSEKPKRKLITSQNLIQNKIDKLKLSKIVTLSVVGERRLIIEINESKKQKEAELDGCYVLKTNVQAETKTPQQIHQQYKQLAVVESAFRTIKTTCLEVRPIYVRKKSRTRGHVFLTMLAFMLVTTFNKKTVSIEDITTPEKISALDHIHTITFSIFDKSFKKIPPPSDSTKQILEALEITLPSDAALNKEPVVA